MTEHITADDLIYERLLRERIVFLGSEVTDEVANKLTAQLLLLASQDPEKDIQLWINSPGGSVYAGLAVYDAIRFIPNDVSTVAMGVAASMGQVLLSAGTRGKRYALPHSRIVMHQPSGGFGGTEADIAIQAEQLVHTKRMMQSLIAQDTGQTMEQIADDWDRDRWFTAEEALGYGFIDRVVSGVRQVPA